MIFSALLRISLGIVLFLSVSCSANFFENGFASMHEDIPTDPEVFHYTVTIQNCRDGFDPIPGKITAVFQKCGKKLKEAKKFSQACLYRCVFKELNVFNDKGEINDEDLEDVAVKYYLPRGEKEKSLKSQKAFIEDFKDCYKTYKPKDWSKTAQNECRQFRKLGDCLELKNKEACAAKGQIQKQDAYSNKAPPKAEEKDDDF